MKIRQIDPFHSNDEGQVHCAAPSSFLQTPFWAEFKSSHGWKAHYFIVEELPDSSSAPVFLSVLVRRFSRLASIAYVPMGPDIICTDRQEQGRLLGSLSAFLSPYLPQNTLCIRFDPPWGTIVANNTAGESDSDASEGHRKNSQALFPQQPAKPAVKAPAHIQPPDTVILDLTKTNEMLLSEMKSKWRYNIKLGEKKGVTIRFMEGEKGASEGMETFYQLYLETAKRDGIAVHSKAYYEDLLRSSALRERCTPYDKKMSMRVYVAEHEGMALASIITLFCGEEALYLYGASSNEKRNLMPAYALQWQAITDAREAGCTHYNFYGIPPTDDPTHPMHGLYRFKTGFGGSIIHRVGSLDIPLKSTLYGVYRLFESSRTLWYKKIVKLFRRETPRKS